MEKRTAYLHIRILPSIKAIAEERAEQEGRSVSNYIEYLIKKEDAHEKEKERKIYTADRETGTFIDEFETIEEAEAAIEQYEADDMKDGVYDEDFYDIVDGNHCSIESRDVKKAGK